MDIQIPLILAWRSGINKNRIPFSWSYTSESMHITSHLHIFSDNLLLVYKYIICILEELIINGSWLWPILVLLLPVVAVVDETTNTATISLPNMIVIDELMRNLSGNFLPNNGIRRRSWRKTFVWPTGGGGASRRYAAAAYGAQSEGRFWRRGVGGRRRNLFDSFGGGKEGSDLEGRRRRRRGTIVFLDEIG